MSTSVRKPTGSLQQHYDKLALILVFALLAASAVYLALSLRGQAATLPSRSELQAATPAPAEPVSTDRFDAMLEQVMNPLQVGDESEGMFVAGLRVASIPDGIPIPYEALVCPFTEEPQPPIVASDERDDDMDGLPNRWENEQGFNPYDPSDASADADGDGFSNAEEYRFETDPQDPASTPPLVVKLRLARTAVEPFILRFRGVSQGAGDALIFQLNARDLERTHFVRMAEEVEGYTVTGYEPDAPEGLPVLVLTRNGKDKRLVRDRIVDEEALVARLLSLADNQRFVVRIGDTITLAAKGYKVVDIREDGVVLRDEADDVEIPIPRLSPGEQPGAAVPGARTQRQPFPNP